MLHPAQVIRGVAYFWGGSLAFSPCRLKLLKIGAVVIRNTRRVALHLSTACPDKALFHLAAAKLKPG